MYIAHPDTESVLQALGPELIPPKSLVLIFLAEKSREEIPGLIQGLKKSRINFCGGVFPGVIYGDKYFDEGAVIVVLPTLDKLFLIKGLNTSQFVVPDFRKIIQQDHRKKYTAIILVDAGASFISRFLSETFNKLGNSFRYFGGGAGSLNLKNSPCIFTPEGEFRNVALVIFTALESNLDVRHGWERLSGPILATSTHNHIISELNWEPALDVYRNYVEFHSGEKLTADTFSRISREYPFGIYKEGSEDVVRDPIAVNEKSELICVGEVPENTALYILHGKKESLLRAAGQAARDCRKREKKKITHYLIADCISRSLFLEDDFQEELKTIEKIIRPGILHGILSIGEIGSHGEAYLEFFNKTIVLGAFYG